MFGMLPLPPTPNYLRLRALNFVVWALWAEGERTQPGRLLRKIHRGDHARPDEIMMRAIVAARMRIYGQ